MSSSCEAGRQEQVCIPSKRLMAALVLCSPRRAWQVGSVPGSGQEVSLGPGLSRQLHPSCSRRAATGTLEIQKEGQW